MDREPDPSWGIHSLSLVGYSPKAAEEVALMSVVTEEHKRVERHQRSLRHGVVSSFAIVGTLLAFILFGLWSFGSGRVMLSGWEFAAVWALVTIGGGIVASLPVRLVFWLCQRTPRIALDRK